MAISVPPALRPLYDFAVHVITGILTFGLVFLAAMLISAGVQWAEAHQFAKGWVLAAAHGAEFFVFALDLVLFALFLLTEALKLIRSLLAEWKL